MQLAAGQYGLDVIICFYFYFAKLDRKCFELNLTFFKYGRFKVFYDSVWHAEQPFIDDIQILRTNLLLTMHRS